MTKYERKFKGAVIPTKEELLAEYGLNKPKPSKADFHHTHIVRGRRLKDIPEREAHPDAGKPASVHLVLFKHPPDVGEGYSEICLYPDKTLWIRHSFFGKNVSEIPLGLATEENVERLHSTLDVLFSLITESEPCDSSPSVGSPTAN